jgi:alginate O-acetyltransferase complex protein AlgI
MVFSSLEFLFLFLPLMLAAYFAMPDRGKNAVLLLFSLLFYAWGEPVYVLLMLFSMGINYGLGRVIAARRGDSSAKLVLVLSIAINLLLLGVFKYGDFVVANLNGLLHIGLPQPNLPLPIGISFYTFKIISYVVDVYSARVQVQKNGINFGAYVALFPQLTAGPIVQYETIGAQLEHRTHSVDQFSEGVRRFMAGLGKKVLLANNIGMLWDSMSNLGDGQRSVVAAWLGVIAYTFQIYFDFSGYSDMAIGLSRMFGFRILENFEYPYISKSITEFWRRWHISLGAWFRKYVYIPLGGNRRGMGRQLLNLAVVWALTGIWHGASWNFLAWGLYYCILLILEKLFLLRWLKKAPAVVGHVYTLFFVMIGWVLFAFDQFSEGFAYIGYLFGGGGIPFLNHAALYALQSHWPMLVLLCVASTPLMKKQYDKAAARWNTGLLTTAECIGIAFVFVISLAYLVDSSYSPFLYFRF